MVALLVLSLFGFDFLKVDIPVERSALGGAGICDFQDGYTTLENPAGLSSSNLKIFSTSIVQYLAGTYFGLVCYQNSPYGLAVNYFNSGTMKRTDENGQELGTFLAQFINTSIARGFKIKEVDLGVGINLIYQGIDDYSSIAAALNTGALYNKDRYSIGIVVKSVGYEIKPYRDSREPLPLTIGLGAGYQLSRINLFADVEKPTSEPVIFSLGTKWQVYDMLDLYGGYNSKLAGIKTGSTIDFISGLSLGISVMTRRYHIAYGITPHADLGLTNRVSFAIIF